MSEDSLTMQQFGLRLVVHGGMDLAILTASISLLQMNSTANVPTRCVMSSFRRCTRSVVQCCMSKLQAAEFLGQLIAFLLLDSNVVSGTVVECHQGFILLAIFIGHLICYQLKEALQQAPNPSATQLTHMHKIGQSSKRVHQQILHASQQWMGR